jgi:hypothetical protein
MELHILEFILCIFLGNSTVPPVTEINISLRDIPIDDDRDLVLETVPMILPRDPSSRSGNSKRFSGGVDILVTLSTG